MPGYIHQSNMYDEMCGSSAASNYFQSAPNNNQDAVGCSFTFFIIYLLVVYLCTYALFSLCRAGMYYVRFAEIQLSDYRLCTPHIL